MAVVVALLGPRVISQVSILSPPMQYLSVRRPPVLGLPIDGSSVCCPRAVVPKAISKSEKCPALLSSASKFQDFILQFSKLLTGNSPRNVLSRIGTRFWAEQLGRNNS